jgi:hypothetical protein
MTNVAARRQALQAAGIENAKGTNNRRSLINCLRALEAEMDPATEAWSFNLQIPAVKEDLALSA